MVIKEAVDVLVQELLTDEHYRIAWEANIAMAFKDQWKETLGVNSDCVGAETVHEIANAAAKNFLNILCHRGD